jgi:hypothetical protein
MKEQDEQVKSQKAKAKSQDVGSGAPDGAQGEEVTRQDELDELFAATRQELDRRAAASQDRCWLELQSRLQGPALKRLEARLERFARTKRAGLSDRLDLALLLLGPEDEPARGVFGTTRFMKMLFLAVKELGIDALVPNPYRFQPYKLGPFSAEVYDDLDVLVRAKLVAKRTLDSEGEPVIQADMAVRRAVVKLNGGLDQVEKLPALSAHYRLTGQGRRFASALLASAGKRRHNLARGLAAVRAHYGTMLLSELLRYVYRQYPTYTTESEILEQVLGPRR